MKKLAVIVLCMMVILSAVSIIGCKGKKTGATLNQSLNNNDLIGRGKGKDFGFGPIGYDLDALVQRLGPEAVKKLRIGVSLTSMSTQWQIQWLDELKILADKYGFRIVALSADSDIQKQAADFKSLQSQQVDGILTYAGNALALALTMTEVNNSGIPIVSAIGVAPEAKIAAYLNVSEEAKGAIIADMIDAESPGKERNVIVSCASIDFPVLNARSRAFEKRVNEKYPHIKIDKRLAEGTETAFLDVIKEGLLANDKIDSVYGTFTWPVMAAYNAGKQLNRNLRIYGNDADEAVLQLMINGDMIVGLQVNFAAPNAYQSLFTLFRILGGEKIPVENWESEVYAMFYATRKEGPEIMKILYGK